MKYESFPIRYLLRTGVADQFWLPAALWALFAFIVWMQRDYGASSLAGGFLVMVLPLIGGILAAYAVLDDPALELHFATPRPAARLLLERLGVILAVMALAAATYQLFLAAAGVDTPALGSLAARQVAWLAPTLALMALGSASAFALSQSSGGALLVGLVWILQLILRGWFASQTVARYFYLFVGMGDPEHPALLANEAALLALATLLALAAWTLLKRQERYL